MGWRHWLLVAVAATVPVTAAAFSLFDNTCVWSREDAIRCIEKHVDTDHNGWVSQAELSEARKRFAGTGAQMLVSGLGWLQRHLSIGVDVSDAKTFKDCDYNHDHRLTADDFRKASATCLPSQAALCMLKRVCDKADRGEKPGWWFT